MASPRTPATRSKRPNGMPDARPRILQKSSQTASTASKIQPAPRLKLIIRRLPPGLTEAEFWNALGNDWGPGKGKIGWSLFKAGKISKDPAKASRASRAYLQVTRQEVINEISERLRNIDILDAKGTHRDVCLLGPPTIEFASYAKVPPARPRKDARQATIDQDAEFIDFLESLTNPVIKSQATANEAAEGKESDKVTTTPLIQFLKEKKANRSKEAAIAKATKQHRHEKGGKEDDATKHSSAVKPGASTKQSSGTGKGNENDRREVVKAVSKRAPNTRTAQPPPSKIADPGRPAAKATVQPNIPPNAAVKSALGSKMRERGNASAAAKILQRDLGLDSSNKGKAARTLATADQTKGARIEADGGTKTTTSKANKGQTGAVEQSNSAARAMMITDTPTRSTGGATSTPNRNTSERPNPFSQVISSPSSAQAQPAQAFLKHVNTSQGITEQILASTFKEFGQVTKIEVDKRKGFAYLDFATSESLDKAIAASPIKIAQGSVQVLERRVQSSSTSRRLQPKPTTQKQSLAGDAATHSSKSEVPSQTDAKSLAAASNKSGGRSAGRGRQGRCGKPATAQKGEGTNP